MRSFWIHSVLALAVLSTVPSACRTDDDSDGPAGDGGSGPPDGNGGSGSPDGNAGDPNKGGKGGSSGESSAGSGAPGSGAPGGAFGGAGEASAGETGEAGGAGGVTGIGGVSGMSGVAGSDVGSSGAGGGGATYAYDCGLFSKDAGWTIASGYRAVVAADESQGLNAPVALTFAEGAFGGLLYVVNAGDNTVSSLDLESGEVTKVVDADGWDAAPILLTSIIWDEHGVFDGNLYVGDQGSNSDGDSRIFRVTPSGGGSVFVSGPNAGLDDVFGLAFAPSGTNYVPGLYATGDTDGAGSDWGRIGASGSIEPFSEVSGGEGIAFDTTGSYGSSLWVAAPAGGGFDGDDAVSPIDENGVKGPALLSGVAGVHAIAFSKGSGALGGRLYAASWSSGVLFAIDPDGTTTELASGLSLTNYDGNIIAPSSDGSVLFVADRTANRVVCIEASTD